MNNSESSDLPDAPNSVDERTHIIALALTQRVGWKLIHRLLEYFGSVEAVLAANAGELRQVQGIGPQIAASICAIDLQTVQADLQRFAAQSITTAVWRDPTYPARLATIDDKPLTLFWKGSFLPNDTQAIAIVGTREAQPESIKAAGEWSTAFAQHGWTVVSGLARGIDSAAHQGALQGGGRTLAVLGSGVNEIYPPENQKLASQIIANGALISEMHPDTGTLPNALMRRNRLITGLSRAVLVIEAGLDSGALYAGRGAYTQGRPVFVLNNSAGNASLLDEFAHLLPDNLDTLLAQIEAYSTPPNTNV
ncbi:MAG: DNA-processing protein DprA [Chloroflexota bacterium]